MSKPMTDTDIQRFREEVEARLRKLDNPELSATFALRMALTVLPMLAHQAEERGFLWYWDKRQREKYLFAVCHALQTGWLLPAGLRISDAVAKAAAYAADAADAAGVPRVAAYVTYTIDDAAKAVADATDITADTATSYAASAAANATAAVRADAVTDITEFIREEFDDLTPDSDVAGYLVTRVTSPLSRLQAPFLSRLRELHSFDYWADWFQDRYDGKAMDKEILEKSVRLPEEITAMEPRAINWYLKELAEREREEKIKRVRAIFIGNGEAGKTSLIQALKSQEAVGNTDMTPGVEISDWSVADTELTAHFWDFGGQVIAHATHQFFLRARCVYILVLNPRSTDTDPNQQAEYWLEFVRAFGNEAPVLLVGNKCDLTLMQVDIRRLQENHPNIQGFYSLSATGYQDVFAREFGIFKDALIKQLNEVGKTQPYFSLEEFAVIEQLRAKSSREPFLEKAAFDRQCEERVIDADRQKDFIQLLDQLGEIIYFPKLYRLYGFLDYLLNPRWLTYGVYQILYSDVLRRQDGRLHEDDVMMLMKDRRIEDEQGNVLDYPEQRLNFLIRTMEQFKLCYPSAGEDEKDKWIVPDLLPSDQPERIDFDDRDALRFDFRFETFLPRHVLSQFIVEHYRDIHVHQVWQHGVCLESRAYQKTTALVRADYQTRMLSLEVSGLHVDRYFSVLYDSVLEILDRMPKLKYAKRLHLDEKARIEGGRGLGDKEAKEAYADFEDLLAQEAAGQRKYFCKSGAYDLERVLRPMPRDDRPLQEGPEREMFTEKNGQITIVDVVMVILAGMGVFTLLLSLSLVGKVIGSAMVFATVSFWKRREIKKILSRMREKGFSA
uniref:non-specific serine/threonine protein kinase n=1 Tax=Candidatus Kentrum sp. FM TaxID=2126340 RepID=A0A450SAU7_9GAMM|nr:MAG: Ras of Complex, Roc, domain of DAPkinase [Candidatus Kentron sp. FM]VFJ49216.1 MAG: Ras of Complex, Roc, domain of DAPkinase [Candidatus Kentron sp. FM]VFK18788.1 MAG: Ras of Complex, Roc, domain of DAPkinase [Candidatus Kentron sp. FM]